jgi:hypothetical protein
MAYSMALVHPCGRSVHARWHEGYAVGASSRELVKLTLNC